eukprot:s2329_g2.t1
MSCLSSACPLNCQFVDIGIAVGHRRRQRKLAECFDAPSFDVRTLGHPPRGPSTTTWDALNKSTCLECRKIPGSRCSPRAVVLGWRAGGLWCSADSCDEVSFDTRRSMSDEQSRWHRTHPAGRLLCIERQVEGDHEVDIEGGPLRQGNGQGPPHRSWQVVAQRPRRPSSARIMNTWSLSWLPAGAIRA